MEIFKKKILAEGIALNENVLKVDSFVNHQVDVELMEQIGEEFANHFRDKQITKVVTIETSGIAPAIMTAKKIKKPLVILKKKTSKILNEDFYQTPVISYTQNVAYNLTMSKNFINKDDKVLIIDDFLATGQACNAAIKLINQAGAKVVGIGILIEKTFQSGIAKLEEQGIDVYSLARVKSLKNGKIEFMD